MGVHKSEFMNPLDKIKCLLEEEIAVLDYEEVDLLKRLSVIEQKRSKMQSAYEALLNIQGGMTK